MKCQTAVFNLTTSDGCKNLASDFDFNWNGEGHKLNFHRFLTIRSCIRELNHIISHGCLQEKIALCYLNMLDFHFLLLRCAAVCKLIVNGRFLYRVILLQEKFVNCTLIRKLGNEFSCVLITQSPAGDCNSSVPCRVSLFITFLSVD